MKTILKNLATLPPALQRCLKIFFLVCALIALLDFIILIFIGTDHVEHSWRFFGFYSLYGFFACVALVLLAKLLRRIVMRAEDYYD